MSCVKNPRWRMAQPTRNTRVAANAKLVSAGRDELALSVVMRGHSLYAPTAGSQHDENDEREEPRDVEVEPVGQRQLKADQHRGGQGGELERRLAAGDEVARDRPHDEEDDRDLLERAEIRNPGRVVLTPAPDREGRVAADLPAEGAVPEDTRRMGRARLEEQDRERGGRCSCETCCKSTFS